MDMIGRLRQELRWNNFPRLLPKHLTQAQCGAVYSTNNVVAQHNSMSEILMGNQSYELSAL